MVAMSPSPKKLALLVIFLTVFIDLLGFGIVLPLLPIYTEDITTRRAFTLGQSKLILVGLMTSFSIMQFVFAPLWGRVSDRIGRRPVLLLSLTGSTVFYGLFGLGMWLESLTLMMLARIGAGIAGATIPTAQAYIADVTTPETRARGMALIGAAFGLGFTFGPLIGAAALWLDPGARTSAWPGAVAAGLSFAALMLALFRLPETIQPGVIVETRKHFDLAALRGALGIPSIGLLLVTGFLAVFALANLESTLTLTIKFVREHGTTTTATAQHVNPREILILFAYIGFIQSVIQGGLVRQLAKRMNESILAHIGAWLGIAGFVLLAVVVRWAPGSTALLLVAVGVEVAGIGFLSPAIQSLISRRSDPTEQGGILGVGDSISTLARICGMAVGVSLFKTEPSLPFWTAAALMAGASILVTAAVTSGRDFEPTPAG